MTHPIPARHAVDESLTYSERLNDAIARIPSASALRVGRVLAETRAEGPGVRAAIWVAGCSLRCHDCFNEHLWSSENHPLQSTRDIGRDVLANEAIRGITLLGGEPFNQAGPLADLAQAARALGKDVLTFTGYTYARLIRWSVDEPDVGRLVSETDLLVDGPFLADRVDTQRPWLGSTNQTFLPLTGAGAALLPQPESTDRVEVTVHADGTVTINGWATRTTLEGIAALARG